MLAVICAVVVVHRRERVSVDELAREARALRRDVDAYKYSTGCF